MIDYYYISTLVVVYTSCLTGGLFLYLYQLVERILRYLTMQINQTKERGVCKPESQ